MTNTRMKDFFDLWVLLRDATLDDAELQLSMIPYRDGISS